MAAWTASCLLMAFLALVLVGIIVSMVIAIVWLTRRRNPATRGGSAQVESPRDILDERYARGEMSREEYLKARDTIGTDAKQT